MTSSEHFFFVDEAKFQPLRPATEDEAKWYHTLANELNPYSKNIGRFDHVHEKYESIGRVIADISQNAAQLECDAKNAVSDFLYSFNEFLDHWKVYLSRTYGKDSDYFKHYEELRKNAFDTHDEYKITYGLRNYQHVEDVLDGISLHIDEPAKLCVSRDKLLADFNLQKDQRKAIEKQPARFDIYPIFRIAKNELEKIQKSLMFFTVTKEQEHRAIDALRFKEQLCGANGVLLLGILLDSDGKELDIDDVTKQKLAENQTRFSLFYQDEIPWGVCRLLELFQGTDYKNI